MGNYINLAEHCSLSGTSSRRKRFLVWREARKGEWLAFTVHYWLVLGFGTANKINNGVCSGISCLQGKSEIEVDMEAAVVEGFLGGVVVGCQSNTHFRRVQTVKDLLDAHIESTAVFFGLGEDEYMLFGKRLKLLHGAALLCHSAWVVSIGE